VVVPSARDVVRLRATSFTIWAAHVLVGVLELDLFPTVTPSTLTIGAPHFFRGALRGSGPSVTLTAGEPAYAAADRLARLLVEHNSSWLPWVLLSADDGVDFTLVSRSDTLCLQLDLAAGVAAEEDLVAFSSLEGFHVAVFQDLAGFPRR